ncbi:hypothetical protein V2G26_013929 [Clonostachys chloroleuca]
MDAVLFKCHLQALVARSLWPGSSLLVLGARHSWPGQGQGDIVMVYLCDHFPSRSGRWIQIYEALPSGSRHAPARCWHLQD